MRLRFAAVAVVIFLLASGAVPFVRGDVVQDTTPGTATINVGYGYAQQSWSIIAMRVRNTGAQPVTITSVTATDPIPGYVYTSEPSPPSQPVAAGGTWEFTIRVDAVSNQGNTDTTTPSTVTVTHSEGTMTMSLPVDVRDWRQGQIDLAAAQTVTHPMPCPAGFDSSRADFSVRVTNTGDYSVSVYNLHVSGIPYFVQSLSSTPFTVGANAVVDRQFRITVPSDADERTFSGTVSASSSANSDSGTFSFAVTHPVDVVMPTQIGRHDFGQVELMRPPEHPWSHLIEERCGYKDGIVTVDTPLPPGYVLVDANPLRVFQGGSALLRIIPRFNSSHANLLLTPQDFQVKFRTNGATNPTYDFRATPSFISVQEMKSRLSELSQQSTSPAGKEVARRTLELVVNRTEVRRPTTPAEVEDAGRIVGLAEPVILAIEQFEDMATLNAEGRQEQAVQSLSVLAAGLESLRSVCNGVVFATDRTECLAIISLLETTMAEFAEAARTHFEGLAGGGLTELGELRAAESLALVLEALGDEEGAAAFDARAQQRFANFTSRIAAADLHLENVETRETLLTPGGFLATDFGYVAWHPFGILFMASYEGYAT
ncbi:MAG TPA: hypothetical protein VGB18_02610, partial [Candidatus Thermoplasmatota archaeon]